MLAASAAPRILVPLDEITPAYVLVLPIVVPEPKIVVFKIWFSVAPSDVDADASHTTTASKEVEVLEMVNWLLPSMVTWSAPLSLIMAPTILPVTVTFAVGVTNTEV